MSDKVAGIATRQALVLVNDMLPWDVSLDKLGKVLRSLDREERLSQGWRDTGQLYPVDVDMLAGELWRMRAGWYHRRDVKGDLDAWVELSDGEWRLLRLPYKRIWNVAKRVEDTSIPERVQMYVWPTGEEHLVLVRRGERYGLPAYGVDTDATIEEETP